VRLDRGTIITRALTRIGNNTNSLQAQARVTLNRVLQDLYLQWDWPFLWRMLPVTIPPSGIFPLPANFVKPEDDQALLVTGSGGISYTHPVQEVDHLHFERLGSPAAEATLPTVWTIDYGTASGRVYPRPMSACAATLRHKWLPPDVAPEPLGPYNADVPTFPWDNYLQDAIVQWGMEYEADPRANDQLMKNREMLALMRGATWPERSFRSTIPLDPTFFTTPFRGE
jgi:hypothetical protein